LIQGAGDMYYAENPPGSGVKSLGLGERTSAEEQQTKDEVKNELF
jgi:penicillin-binding protein 1A